MVADDPGGTRSTWSRPEVEGIGTFEEATTKEVRRYANMYRNIYERYKVGELGAGELLMLRKLLTSDPKTMKMALKGQLNDNITKAAGAFRNMLNSLYQYAKKAGVDISYLDENAYLPVSWIRHLFFRIRINSCVGAVAKQERSRFSMMSSGPKLTAKNMMDRWISWRTFTSYPAKRI